MFALTLSVFLATASPPAAAAAPASAQRTRVLVLDLKASGGVTPDVVENITGLVAALLSEDPRLEVLAGPDLRDMLALQAQKETAGCNESASCVAEVAGALGAKLVVFGNVGYLGKLLNMNVTLFDQDAGRNIGRRAIQAAALDDVPAALREPLAGLVAEAIGARHTAAPAPTAATAGPSALPLVSLVAGGVGVVGGAVALIVGAAPAAQIADEEARFKVGDALALDRAARLQSDWYDNNLAPALLLGGGALAAVGAAGVVVGILTWGGQ